MFTKYKLRVRGNRRGPKERANAVNVGSFFHISGRGTNGIQPTDQLYNDDST